MSHKLKMGNPNALSSLEIKLLHLLKDGPAGIKTICQKLQVVEEHGQKLTKKLIEQRFVTKQTNSQYRNLIKAEDLPPLKVIKALPPRQVIKSDPEKLPYSCEAKPGNICTHPICTCIKAKCEEEPVVNIDNCFKISLGDRTMDIIGAEAKELLGSYKVDTVNPINQPGVTFNADQLVKVRKLIAIDKANALRQTAFAEIDAEAIVNAMEKRKDSPLDDDLKQELYLIAEQLEQKQPTLIKLSNIDKKLNLISYMRLILQNLPQTRRLLDDIEADYMELKRLQELQP